MVCFLWLDDCLALDAGLRRHDGWSDPVLFDMHRSFIVIPGKPAARPGIQTEKAGCRFSL
ncbi:MAG: hypothetical protein SV201_15260 [Pseudomonadota bacterium]|nr:hypothetical protein [Pseudomonadota bacterium]